MRTYDQARALVGTIESASWTNGRTKYIHYETRANPSGAGLVIAARLFTTDIVTWYPGGRIVLDNGRWNTPTTYDGMATALGIQRASIGTRKYVPHLFGEPFEAGHGGGPIHYTLTIEPGQSS